MRVSPKGSSLVRRKHSCHYVRHSQCRPTCTLLSCGDSARQESSTNSSVPKTPGTSVKPSRGFLETSYRWLEVGKGRHPIHHPSSWVETDPLFLICQCTLSFLLAKMIRGALGWQNHVSFHLLQVLYGLCDDWFYISARLRVPRHLAQHYLDVSVKMCLFMRLTFEWVDWVKQIASLMWVSLTQSAEDWNRTKRLSKENSFCLTSLSWDIGLFQPSGTEKSEPTEKSALLGSGACQLLDWN